MYKLSEVNSLHLSIDQLFKDIYYYNYYNIVYNYLYTILK